MNGMTILISAAALVGTCSGFVSPAQRPATFTTISSTSLNLFGRFRKKKNLELKEITVGSPIPEVDVEMLTTNDEGLTTVAVAANEVLNTPGKSILVGMPGAFTPVCTSEHLPGFIDGSAKLFKLGVEKIAVVTTNDKFVNEQWARSSGLIEEDEESTKEPVVTILSDADGELVKQLGLAEDMGFGVGLRSKRFALVFENGLVTQVLTDDGMDTCELTSATSLIEVLTPEGYVEETELDGNLLAGVGVVMLGLALLSMMGGGDDPGATLVPAFKAGAKGGGDFSLLDTFGSS